MILDVCTRTITTQIITHRIYKREDRVHRQGAPVVEEPIFLELCFPPGDGKVVAIPLGKMRKEEAISLSCSLKEWLDAWNNEL